MFILLFVECANNYGGVFDMGFLGVSLHWGFQGCS